MNGHPFSSDGSHFPAGAICPDRKQARKILVVEDESDLAEAFLRILRGAGYETRLAGNGAEACAAIDEMLPDLILSDINMPGLNGHELLRYVRAKTSLAPIPVVFLTALRGGEHHRQAMSLGADDFLNKPIRREDLLGAVESRLERAASYREECQTRLRLQKDFVSVVAHDLRAPITALALGLDLPSLRVRQDDLSCFDTMEQALESMAGMVDRLLLMARGQGECIPFEPKPVNLATLCERAAAMAKGYRSLHHALDIRVKTGATAHIDPVIVEQVLTNLLLNAFKYSPAGGLVTLTADADGQDLRLEVADRGTGMSPDDVRNLFSAFYRSPEHRDIAGHGIGLFGTKLLVERHGGRIECRSTLGVGTKFTVTLPATRALQASAN